MSSRDKILGNIKANQPEIVPLPEVVAPSTDYNTEMFIATLKGIGGDVKLVANEDSIEYEINEMYSAESLEKIEIATIRGVLGVAENGAIWVNGDALEHRVIPFICQHLVIVLHEKDIVPTMHHAYSKIDVASHGFGVFIAGPSKTADIEQSLVTGAHGARSLVVYLVR